MSKLRFTPAEQTLLLIVMSAHLDAARETASLDTELVEGIVQKLRVVRCAHAQREPWDCACSFGCDCCDLNSRCLACRSLLKSKPTVNLEG